MRSFPRDAQFLFVHAAIMYRFLPSTIVNKKRILENTLKQFLSFLLCCTLTHSLSPFLRRKTARSRPFRLGTPSVLLMEASTGNCGLRKKNAHEIRHSRKYHKNHEPLILIFDAIERRTDLPDRHGDRIGEVPLQACGRAHRCILRAWGDPERRDHESIVSALRAPNDACVAMAEYLCGFRNPNSSVR